ncbi:MAG: ECN family pore-forming entericidin [Planctomycetota bacterium]|nr:ECN family pore-forming entericidin [Planctomycetota bacterium]
MVKRTLLLIALVVVAFSVIGCQTAKGVKEDAQFIGDKTYEVLDNS